LQVRGVRIRFVERRKKRRRRRRRRDGRMRERGDGETKQVS
jgi:hypothetical protein